jgi:hypothetical protein
MLDYKCFHQIETQYLHSAAVPVMIRVIRVAAMDGLDDTNRSCRGAGGTNTISIFVDGTFHAAVIKAVVVRCDDIIAVHVMAASSRVHPWQR